MLRYRISIRKPIISQQPQLQFPNGIGVSWENKAISPPYAVQMIETFGQLSNKQWANQISRDMSWKELWGDIIGLQTLRFAFLFEGIIWKKMKKITHIEYTTKYSLCHVQHPVSQAIQLNHAKNLLNLLSISWARPLYSDVNINAVYCWEFGICVRDSILLISNHPYLVSSAP